MSTTLEESVGRGASNVSGQRDPIIEHHGLVHKTVEVVSPYARCCFATPTWVTGEGVSGDNFSNS